MTDQEKESSNDYVNFGKDIEAIFKKLSLDYVDVAKDVKALSQKAADIKSKVQKAMDEGAQLIAQFREAALKYPPIMKSSLITLADEGWYLDWTGMALNDPIDLAELCSEGKHTEAEAWLVEHYTGRLPEIEAELRKLFPNRAHILDQAFSAHRQGNFYLSVPAFLAQADGIYFEFHGENFFMTRDAKGKFSAETKDHDELFKALTAPFSNTTSIRKTGKERGADFIYLNRHVVMHGESLDYGTEVKSLQAVSLLYYVALSFSRIMKRRASTASE